MNFSQFAAPAAPQRAYAAPFRNRFEIKAEPNTPGAESRTNKNGEIKYFIPLKVIEGTLQEIRRWDGKYDPELRFTIRGADGDLLIVSCPWNGNVSQRFLNCLPNINYRKPIRLEIDGREDNGAYIQKLFISQDGTNIKNAFTRENPNGKPEWKPVTINGRKEYDRSEETAFYTQLIEMAQIILDNLGTGFDIASGNTFGDSFATIQQNATDETTTTNIPNDAGTIGKMDALSDDLPF